MARRISWEFTTSCCGRTLYRGARPPGGLLHCYHCDTERRPSSETLIGGTSGACSRGHEALVKDNRGRVVCLTCHQATALEYRERKAHA